MANPLRYPPTPWITAVHPTAGVKYRFRLYRLRLDGRIYVKFSKESEVAPGKDYGVPPKRKYWYDWTQAALRLLSTSAWNPKIDPGSVAAAGIWKRHLQAYATNGDDVNIVVHELPRLIDPKLGHPSRVQQRASAHVSTNVSHVAARNARYGDLTRMVRDMHTRMHPMYERMQDARRMKGYTKDEINPMLSLLDTVKHNLDALKRMLESNDFKHTATRAHSPIAASAPMLIDETLPEAMSMGTALSPQEQRIAKTIPRVIVGEPEESEDDRRFYAKFPRLRVGFKESETSDSGQRPEAADSGTGLSNVQMVQKGFSFGPE